MTEYVVLTVNQDNANVLIISDKNKFQHAVKK